MILLATFVSVSVVSGRREVPSIEVEQIKVPSQAEGMAYSTVKTKKLCEAMGREYANSLYATLPSGTTVVMSCVGDAKVDYDEVSE